MKKLRDMSLRHPVERTTKNWKQFIASNCSPLFSEHFPFLFPLISQLLKKIQGFEENVDIDLIFPHLSNQICYTSLVLVRRKSRTFIILILKNPTWVIWLPTDVAKAVALIEIGTSYGDVAEMLGKAKSMIYRNVRRWRQTGEYVRRRG